MKYKIKSKLWIETEKGIFIGEGRYQLLKAIDQKGSLNKAAKLLSMSYKKALRLMNDVNEAGKKPSIISIAGGKNGGGTKLTDYGRKAIANYENLKSGCWKYLEKEEKNIKL